MPLTFAGEGNFLMTSTLALSTLMPCIEILWPNTMPLVTMKWHFSQLSTKFVSTHHFSTMLRLDRHKSKEEQKKKKKSSIKTAILFFNEIRENRKHAPLKCSRSITQTKRYLLVSKNTQGTSKSCLFLIFRTNTDLIISWIPIKKLIKFLVFQSLQHLIHKW